MDFVKKAQELLDEATAELCKLNDVITALELVTDNGAAAPQKAAEQLELFEMDKKTPFLNLAVRKAMIKNAGSVMHLDQITTAARKFCSKRVKKSSVGAQLWFDVKAGAIAKPSDKPVGYYVLPKAWIPRVEDLIAKSKAK